LEEFKFSFASLALSIPIPLAAPIDEAHTQNNPVGFPIESGESESTPAQKENCPGSVSDPKAKAGYFCLYTKELKNSLSLNPSFVAPFVIESSAGGNGVGTTGAVVRVLANEDEPSSPEGRGTWAVTAPAP
jgi:hypothetical protein